jgi:hypothetical protein
MATGSTTKQTLLDQIDTKVPTANATELSQLAKSLNNVQEIVPEDRVFAGKPRGPDELYFERDAEFVIWCGRNTSHGYGGGGSTVYDSNLDIYDSRKYVGYHCYSGVDGTFGHHTWSDVQSYHHSCNYCWLETTNTSHTNHCYINGTDAVGELGHYRLKMGEAGTIGFYNCHLGDFRIRENINIGSWEVRDNRYYVSYVRDKLVMQNRFMTLHGKATATSTKDIPGTTGMARGSTSYNRKRKEAVFLNPATPTIDIASSHQGSITSHYWNAKLSESGSGADVDHSSGNQMNRIRCRIYYGIQQVDGTTNLEKVLDDKTAKNLYFNWIYGMNSGFIGSHWSMKCVLVDNGCIYAMTQLPYHSYTLLRLVRQRDDRAIRAETRQNQWCNDCYGLQNHHGTGQRIVQSRNKRNVAMYGPYYRYGSGSCGWIISRDMSREYPELWNRHTSWGIQVAPFRDGDFYIHYCQNWNDLGGYNKTSKIAFQNGKGHFESYWVGNQMDANGHTDQYPAVVPIHKDGLTY